MRRAVELLPKALIAGLIVPPPNVPGGTQVTIDRLNHIWAELSATYGYRQMQMAADGSSAHFIGATDADAVVIEPPLLQVRDVINLTPAQSADKVQSVFKVIARHLGVTQFANFAVRHIYHAPAPENDARAFVLTRVLGKTEDDLGELQAGASLWAGVKFVVTQNDGAQYTVIIEPLQRDERFIYIDLDAQFQGPSDLDRVATRASDAETYIKQAVNGYLDKH